MSWARESGPTDAAIARAVRVVAHYTRNDRPAKGGRTQSSPTPHLERPGQRNSAAATIDVHRALAPPLTLSGGNADTPQIWS